MQAYSIFVMYKAHWSLYEYYKAFNPLISYDDFVRLVRCSQGVREVLKHVITDKLTHAPETDLNFTLKEDDVCFFDDYSEDTYLHVAQLYHSQYGEGLIQASMLLVEMKYFVYINQLNQEKDVPIFIWNDFIDKLISDPVFREPCYTAYKDYIVNILDFTGSWFDKNVVGLLNSEKPLVSQLDSSLHLQE